MIKCWIDLHIHSCLSPCADEDMTPNNIVNMALIKGLDIIAITDHNSAENARAVVEAGARAGLVVVPGMELCTSEEIHLVCLFPELLTAHEFQRVVYKSLPPIKNREHIFGPQILMDAWDQELGREDRLLSVACGLDIETAIKLVRQLGGAVIPSHINRESFSLLNTLGAVPEEYHFTYLECSKNCSRDSFIREHPELNAYKLITSSDAHFLGDILEQEVSLELPEKSIPALLACINDRRDPFVHDTPKG